MSGTRFSTPEEAEAGFYKAFEDGDLEAMMAVWATGDDVVCIHPLRPRLVGLDLIKESWSQIFRHSPKMKIEINNRQHLQVGDLAVHVLNENFLIGGEAGDQSPVLATNVYRLTDLGWRMILHHASPLTRTAPDAGPPVLH